MCSFPERLVREGLGLTEARGREVNYDASPPSEIVAHTWLSIWVNCINDVWKDLTDEITWRFWEFPKSDAYPKNGVKQTAERMLILHKVKTGSAWCRCLLLQMRQWITSSPQSSSFLYSLCFYSISIDTAWIITNSPFIFEFRKSIVSLCIVYIWGKMYISFWSIFTICYTY